jgi:hypothetical protein
MPLALSVVLVVLGVTALLGAAAYLIDKSARRGERK